MSITFNNDIAKTYFMESTLSARNKLFAARAKAKGDIPVEKLLSIFAESEEIHARRALMHLRGKIGAIEAYLEDLMEFKYDMHMSEYPKMAADAEKNQQKTVSELFDQFGKVSKTHYDLLKLFLDKKINETSIFYICRVCGHIEMNEIPDRCPVCNAVPERFKKIG